MKIGFAGLRRSGNHILIEWVASHYGTVKHHNDCRIVPGPKFKTDSPVQTYTGKGGQDALFFSFEERSFKNAHEILEHDNEFDNVIFILRDVYNWAASLMIGRGEKHLQGLADTWKSLARLYLTNPERFLLYDMMVTDSDYRKNAKERLKIPYANDKLPSRFPRSGIGKGSSFGKFSDNPKEFLRRDQKVFKKYGDKPPKVWTDLIEDEEIGMLNEKIFGRRL